MAPATIIKDISPRSNLDEKSNIDSKIWLRGDDWLTGLHLLEHSEIGRTGERNADTGGYLYECVKLTC